ncbi:hypothetical protein HYFRA_00012673 [Hymenoscyphus fraxineus]|uniref:DUF7082 domain-containing protein n=1 Tax=Hymenoscyphus fraxineus TaxID=746836 RepID=A0A9N9L7I0_9HELO|nr:hypothetical protein HYFRA_00012673 [Hymenoscyphus fraxineus]
MSAYGKPPQLHGYDASRTYPEGSFPYAAPSYGSQPGPSPASTPGFPNPAQVTPITFPSSHSRAPYDDQSGPFLNVGSTPNLEVTSFSPTRGSGDTRIYVYITTLYELLTSITPVFFLNFGQYKCQASISKSNQQGGVCQYTLSANVPDFAETNWDVPQVPIEMLMESGDGDVMAKTSVGSFTYISSTQSANEGHDLSRKRKVSVDSPNLMLSPVKRSASQLLRPKEEYGGGYGYSQAGDGSSSYSSYLPTSHSYSNIVPQYQRAIPGFHSQPSSRHLGYGYSNSSNASPPTHKAPSPQVGTWNNGPYGSSMGRSHGGMNRPSLSALPSPASSANPALIRTSTLQNTPSPGTTPHGSHPGQPFNAYNIYPNKAKLEINGELTSMRDLWSEEEKNAKRRLVVFRRSQSGSTITTTFQPVTPEDRNPSSICISCIFWEERNEYFVTSVDTIYLLEQLIAVRFPVEEKNRIRRNLEGFRPLTVSKGKAESEKFFQVIMKFPTPKPRNIEKDVKVFHWKDLASALKKIVGKYSASPASTLPPASSSGYAPEGSSAGISYVGDHHGALSPRSISGSTSSTGYAANIPARVLSPLSQKTMSLTGGPPDLRVGLPTHPHEPSNHWQGGAPHHMQSSQQQYPQLGPPQNSRGSWDMSPYLENNAANTTGGAGASGPPHHQALSQPMNYNRNVADTAVTGGESRLPRSFSQQQQQQHQSHQMPLSR